MLTSRFRHFVCAFAVLWFSTTLHSAQLTTVRFGSHQGFDRVVCELSEAVPYKVMLGETGTVEVHLEGVTVGEKFFLPNLPPQIKLLISVEAFLEGDDIVVLEIKGSAPLTAQTTVLQGQTWRLATDLSLASALPKSVAPENSQPTSTTKTKTKHKAASDEPVPYIPGDKPIETILADEHSPEKQVLTPDSAHLLDIEPVLDVQPELAAKSSRAEDPQVDPVLQPPVADDSLKALEILAEFYDVMGDQDAAREYARIYLNRVDSGDALLPNRKSAEEATWPVWLLAAIAFAAGIAGGIIGNRLRIPTGAAGMKSFRLFVRKEKTSDAAPDTAEELVADLNSLERAVASEPAKNTNPSKVVQKPAVAETPAEVAKQAEQAFPAEPDSSVEEDMKDSLMDRRVKRVLELHAQKRSLAEIAQELDMGQDEVKLIIDLNS